MTTKICCECRRKFKPEHGRQTICSDSCRDLRKRKYNRDYRNKPGVRAKQREYLRRYRKANPAWTAWVAKKHHAKDRGIHFSLSFEWFAKQYEKGCAISGIAFSRRQSSMTPYSTSVDRIDPNIGYTESNSQLVLQAVNAMKGAGTDEDVYKIAKAITKEAT